MQVIVLGDKYYKMMQCIPLIYFQSSVNVCYVNSIMRVRVSLCNDVLSQNYKKGRLLGH